MICCVSSKIWSCPRGDIVHKSVLPAVGDQSLRCKTMFIAFRCYRLWLDWRFLGFSLFSGCFIFFSSISLIQLQDCQDLAAIHAKGLIIVSFQQKTHMCLNMAVEQTLGAISHPEVCCYSVFIEINDTRSAGDALPPAWRNLFLTLTVWTADSYFIQLQLLSGGRSL